MCVTDPHDMTLAVKVALNPNTTNQTTKCLTNTACYFMLSGRISKNIGENIFRFYTGTTSENTDFHALVA